MSAASPDLERARPRWFTVVELLAVAATIACVWLTAKAHILCWPIGIAGCILYLYVFYYARLYSDVLLQVYFLATSFYGWYQWQYGGDGATELAVSRLSTAGIVSWASVLVVSSLALGFFMKRKTRAALPYWDAATTALSVVAQYLLTEKVLESWVLWIIADIIDTGLYLKRKLYATAILYAILLVLATKGLFEWMGML
jgi:nicotinamide mononucleotide transporter